MIKAATDPVNLSPLFCGDGNGLSCLSSRAKGRFGRTVATFFFELFEELFHLFFQVFDLVLRFVDELVQLLRRLDLLGADDGEHSHLLTSQRDGVGSRRKGGDRFGFGKSPLDVHNSATFVPVVVHLEVDLTSFLHRNGRGENGPSRVAVLTHFEIDHQRGDELDMAHSPTGSGNPLTPLRIVAQIGRDLAGTDFDIGRRRVGEHSHRRIVLRTSESIPGTRFDFEFSLEFVLLLEESANLSLELDDLAPLGDETGIAR